MKTFSLGNVKVGLNQPVRVMAVINASPESFYKASVKTSERAIAMQAREHEKQGAVFIDVGAMSTAPYLKTQISEKEEARRLARAVAIVRDNCDVPISADTSRRQPAEAALKSGATILNDVTGLKKDPALAQLKKDVAGWILMAHPSWSKKIQREPVRETKDILTRIIGQSKNLGLPMDRVVLDPGIGFFRTAKTTWWKWDVAVLKQLSELVGLGFPLLVGVSRKSFVGHLLGGRPSEDRLFGSLSVTALAVEKGASIIRTHDVSPTLDTATAAAFFRRR